MINAYRDGVPGNGKLFPDGCVPLFRDGSGHLENGRVHREGYQAISEHARMGICPVGL
jgi:hypothetical protein